MRSLRVLGSWILGGLIGGIVVACALGGFVPTSFSVGAFVSAAKANLIFILIAAGIGTIVGFGIGVFQVLSGRNKLPGDDPSRRRGQDSRTSAVPTRPAGAFTSSPSRPLRPPGLTPANPQMGKPGWYPDPYEMARLRWWEGDRWTDRVMQ